MEEKKLKPLFRSVLILVAMPIWLPLLVAFTVVAIPLIPIFITLHKFKGYRLKIMFGQKWETHGKRILFVYSESPNWKPYVEKTILPKLETHVVTLNWSLRSEWRKTMPLEAKIFRHWGGDKEFNPIAIVLPKKGKVAVIRFWQAFKDARHGKEQTLRKAEAELYGLLEKINQA